MARVFREDRSPVKGGTITAEGFLDTEGALTRTGIFEYAKVGGGVQRELRLPEHVFAPAALAGLDGVPLTFDAATLDHPRDGNGAVRADNFRRHVVGFVRAPRQDGDHVRAQVRIMDQGAVSAVQAGVKDLSVGYYSDLVPIPGGIHRDSAGVEHRADFLQTNVQGNHVALVRRGRAGPTVRLDSAGNQAPEDQVDLEQMKTALAAAEALAAKAQTEVATLTLAAVKTDAERAATAKDLADLRVKLDAFEASRKADAVKALAGRVAAVIKKDAAELSGKSEAEIMRAGLAVVAPSFKCDTLEGETLRGAFEAVMSQRADGASAAAVAVSGAKSGVASTVHADSVDEGTLAARDRMNAMLRDAWKKGR